MNLRFKDIDLKEFFEDDLALPNFHLTIEEYKILKRRLVYLDCSENINDLNYKCSIKNLQKQKNKYTLNVTAKYVLVFKIEGDNCEVLELQLRK